LGGKELNPKEWAELENIFSHGLAKDTWSNYRTACSMLARCCQEKDIELTLPIKEETTMAFIHWLIFHRKVKAGTIENYLAGIRQFHSANNIQGAELRTERIKTILKGLRNKEMAKSRREGTERRKPITIDMLKLLKARLSESDYKGVDQRLIWTVSSLLFHGAFRAHELMCKIENSFDPAFSLLGQDAVLLKEKDNTGKEMLQIKLKAPKENKKGNTVIVDVFQTDNDICPVKAFRKWVALQPLEKDKPVFRFASGVPLTGRKFNEILRERLRGFVKNIDTLYSSHSFRSGAASRMAELGYADKDIKAVGRWSSRAFLDYIRLPRTNRVEVTRLWGSEK